MARTFVMIKSNAVKRGLVGRVIQRFEDKNIRVVHLQELYLGRKAEVHYAEHKDKPYYPSLLGSIQDGPVVAMLLEGPDNIISTVRQMCGATDPEKALPGTIRGDFGTKLPYNVVHSSDSSDNAKKEIRNILELGLIS